MKESIVCLLVFIAMGGFVYAALAIKIVRMAVESLLEWLSSRLRKMVISIIRLKQTAVKSIFSAYNAMMRELCDFADRYREKQRIEERKKEQDRIIEKYCRTDYYGEF